jgi:YfiH family protein
VRLAGAAAVRFSGRAEGDLGATAGAEANRARLLELCGVGSAAAGRQVHGAHVAVVRDAPQGYSVAAAHADGQATSLPGVAVAVHVADCLPIAIAGEGGVAMLHGGWRGLAGGIIAEGVRVLREELGVSGRLEAAIGPGAGVCCYEAGEEVHAALAGASRGRNVDLRAAARAQLEAAGVEVTHDVARCTICDGDFFSHRRGDRERQAGLVWMAG